MRRGVDHAEAGILQVACTPRDRSAEKRLAGRSWLLVTTKGVGMGVSLRSVGAITLFVEDLERCRAFYERVFAARVVYEDQDSAVFDFDGTLVNLLTVAGARDLIAP